MYAHHLIDSLTEIKKLIDLADKENRSIGSALEEFRNSDFVLDVLKNSQHFFLGEYGEFAKMVSDDCLFEAAKHKNIYSENGFTLPYSDVCLHFSNHRVQEYMTEKEAVETEGITLTKKIIFGFRIYNKHDLSYFVCTEQKAAGVSVWRIDHPETNLSFSWHAQGKWAEVDGPDLAFFHRGSKGAHRVVFPEQVLDLFSMFLNTKNICASENKPPEKLNKKRIKKGKSPLYRYHTLLVEVPGNKKVQSGLNGQKRLMSLHLCRGHFKNYTEEKPLFGKYTGRYWWQPQARGNKKQGVVMKDYSVNFKRGITNA